MDHESPNGYIVLINDYVLQSSMSVICLLDGLCVNMLAETIKRLFAHRTLLGYA